MYKVGVKHAKEHYINTLCVKNRQGKTDKRTSENSVLMKQKKLIGKLQDGWRGITI